MIVRLLTAIEYVTVAAMLFTGGLMASDLAHRWRLDRARARRHQLFARPVRVVSGNELAEEQAS